jgi:sugar/nucleoside kinase (ribokinase family)
VAAPPELLVIGAASRDIDEGDERGWRLGGSVSYAALLAARLGARVAALIGVDPLARDAHELRLLEQAGVEITCATLERGPVFHNVETPRGRQQIGHQASDPLPIEALPAVWRSCTAVFLAPVAGELPEAWAHVFEEDVLLALAWQGLLRRIDPGLPVAALPVRVGPLIARADLASVSREDLAGGGDATLHALLPRPGQELAVTADERGAVHIIRGPDGLQVRRLPSVPARRRIDPTGAGDSFQTAWLLARMPGGPFSAAPLDVGRSLHVAAVVGSLAVEGQGLDGVPDRRLLAQRLAELTQRSLPRHPVPAPPGLDAR